ncbi:MAG: TIGR00266 family protein [Planctomycetaceae bacterium]|nr:TIGR00266 family protein [Planctomycetota bacterium]NUN53721.1 TIGR00266 family protein [Planctomycetaceae bacterium]
MHVTLEKGPAFTLARVALDLGEVLKAESGAMVSMSGTVDIETGMKGGFLKSVARKLLTSESFFQNTFTARAPGEVTLAPAMPGDIHLREMAGESLILQSGSYLGSGPDVEIETKWGGARSFFSREGLFLLRAYGAGPLLFSSYGAIVEVDVPASGYLVDTGHLVAFEPSLEWTVDKVGGMKSLLFSGEGLVCRFRGRGRLWLQTRSFDAFLGQIVPHLTRGSDGSAGVFG